MGYTKLFSSIVHSTIWREPNETRLVWITMLALADRDGIVEASIPGLADAARVSISECERALGTFLAPDPYSRSKAQEGRRIEVIPGGWLLINHSDHRERATAEEMRAKEASRKRRQREKKKAASLGHVPGVPGQSRDVPQSPQMSTQAEAEAEAEKETPPTPSGRRPDPFAQSFEQPREDVARVHAQWQRTFGLKNHALGGPSTVDYRCIADAIDTHGEPACLLVLRHARSDGMVNGKQDEKNVKHESIRYIFGNADAFARIHRDGAEREGRGRGGDALDVVARGKAL